MSLYKTFYRHASSMRHVGIGGALVAARAVLRCVSYVDEMAQLGNAKTAEDRAN